MQSDLSATKNELEALREQVREKSEEYLGSVEALRKESEEVEKLKARVKQLEEAATKPGVGEEKNEEAAPKDEDATAPLYKQVSTDFVKDVMLRAASPVDAGDKK